MLDGACRTDKIVDLAKQYNMPAVAMTDHGNMFGTIDFYNKAKRAGIKPIIGMEAYIVNGELEDPKTKQDLRHHLVLLVQNDTGYHNLMKLSSVSFTKGFYYKPRISKSLLKEHSEGLICLSACLHGEIPHLLLEGKKEEALEVIRWYKEVFPDRFYIELMDHGLEDERKVKGRLIEIARETDTPMVVTNDCHYLKKEDAEAHDVLLCIQTGKSLGDPNRMRYETTQLYFKTEEEMRALFPDVPEAYDNTVKIAETIEFDLPYKDFLFPKIDIPAPYEESYDYFRALVYKGAETRYPELTDEIKERIEFEIDVIHRMGYVDYFLIVKDFIDAARSRDIPVGPGRGSAAGSIVAYLLDITQLDPLEYGLLFERFLDLKRVGMPDIDIDFCADGRGEVINYVVEKYGRNAVTQIVTFTTLGARSVIKDVARVLDIPASEANLLTKKMPFGPKVTIESSLKESTEFADAMNSREDYRNVLKYSQVLEGLVRQIGVHAAGVVIGPGDLSDYVPLAVSSQKDGPAALLVQYEGKWLDDLKLLKMDFLGLKTLTIIRRAVDLIRQYKGEEIDIENVALDDEKAYELLSNGQTDGIFQFESTGMKKYLQELKPNVFADLIAMVALYRPGPMQFIDTFINRKHGREKVVYDHPLAEEILKETYGVTVYQEQVMQIAKVMAGFPSAEAGVLRKAISKKKRDLMEELHVKFRNGCVQNGVKAQVADKIWNDWEGFANYAFNKSHSACYAYIAYQTAWLKAHYPVEFMTAILSVENDPAKIPYFLDECKKMEIEVISPDINKSVEAFSVEDDKILFGLRGIKNVGSAAINAIVGERKKEGAFKTLFEFCTRVDTMAVNRAVIESLVSAGAMDCLEGSRAQKVAVIEEALNHGNIVQQERNSAQINLFDVMSDTMEPEENEPQMPANIPDWTLSYKLEQEKKFLGFYISGHPLMQHKPILDLYTNTNTKNFGTRENGGFIKIAGIATDMQVKTDRQGNPYSYITFEDLYGKFEIGLFSDDYVKFHHRIQAGKEYLIVGRRKNGNGQEDAKLRVYPKRIIALEELPSEAGELEMHIKQEGAGKNLAQILLDQKLKNPGNVKMRFYVKTKKFRELVITVPETLCFFPSGDFMERVDPYLRKKPFVVLDFEKNR